MNTNNKTINHLFHKIDGHSKNRMFDVIIQSSEKITTKQVETKLKSGLNLRSGGWLVKPSELRFDRLITGEELSKIYTYFTTHIYEYTDLVKGKEINELGSKQTKRDYLINLSYY